VKARLPLLLAAVVFVLVTWRLWPRGALSPEEEIRALVARCVVAAEDRELGVITEAMAPRFSGPQGASRDEVKGLLLGLLMRNREIVGVFNPSLEVTVDAPDRAHLSGKFVFARVKAKSIDGVPEGGVLSSYRIDAALEKADGHWLFVKADARGE